MTTVQTKRSLWFALAVVALALSAVTPLLSTADAVHVKGYVTKKGTYVAPHERRSPGTAGTPSYRVPTIRSTGTTYKAAPKYAVPKYRAKKTTFPYFSRLNHHLSSTRDFAQRLKFVRLHPCPSTGKKYGACPGYVVDHIIPLKRGGPDDPSNMQWQTVEQGKAKDRWE